MQNINRSMLCPTCKKRLIQNVLHGQQVDECEACDSLWVDEGELTAMLSVLNAVPEPAVPVPHAAKEALKQQHETEPICCPACLVDIPPSVYAYDSGIIVNRCEQCRGTWLTIDELSEIAAYQKGSSKVNALATAIASRHQSEHRSQKLSALVRSKKISGTVALSCVIFAAAFKSPERSLNIFCVVTLACMLIWCGDYLESVVNYSGYFSGISSPRITAPTPGIFIVLFGWLLLLVTLVIAIRG